MLLGIEFLDCIFDLVHRVKLESVLVNGVDHLVHPIEEDPDGLLNLLITHQVLKVAIRVVTLILLVYQGVGRVWPQLLSLSSGELLFHVRHPLRNELQHVEFVEIQH